MDCETVERGRVRYGSYVHDFFGNCWFLAVRKIILLTDKLFIEKDRRLYNALRSISLFIVLYIFYYQDFTLPDIKYDQDPRSPHLSRMQIMVTHTKPLLEDVSTSWDFQTRIHERSTTA